MDKQLLERVEARLEATEWGFEAKGFWKTDRECMKIVKALLEDLSNGARVVPGKLTEDMMDAMIDFELPEFSHDGAIGEVSGQYESALKTAPLSRVEKLIGELDEA